MRSELGAPFLKMEAAIWVAPAQAGRLRRSVRSGQRK